MSSYCRECGESYDECVIAPWVSGCSCIATAVRKIKAKAESDAVETADARVLALLTAIGNPGQCKDCGADVFFVLHHKDRGVAPSAGFAYANKWREWRKFEPDGTPHKHPKARRKDYDPDI